MVPVVVASYFKSKQPHRTKPSQHRRKREWFFSVRVLVSSARESREKSVSYNLPTEHTDAIGPLFPIRRSFDLCFRVESPVNYVGTCGLSSRVAVREREVDFRFSLLGFAQASRVLRENKETFRSKA